MNMSIFFIRVWFKCVWNMKRMCLPRLSRVVWNWGLNKLPIGCAKAYMCFSSVPSISWKHPIHVPDRSQNMVVHKHCAAFIISCSYVLNSDVWRRRTSRFGPPVQIQRAQITAGDNFCWDEEGFLNIWCSGSNQPHAPIETTLNSGLSYLIAWHAYTIYNREIGPSGKLLYEK